MAPLCTFPFRLHAILDQIYDSDVDGEASIVSWTPTGRSFRIHDLEAFKKRFLPKYFPCQSKYRSFRRQLQYYGFINLGYGDFCHPFFVRKNKDVLYQVKHNKANPKKEEKSCNSRASAPGCGDSSLLLPESPTRDTARESLTRLIMHGMMADGSSQPKEHASSMVQQGALIELASPQETLRSSSSLVVNVPHALQVIANAERRCIASQVLSSSSSLHHHHRNTLNQAIARQHQQLALLDRLALLSRLSLQRPGHQG